MLLANATVNDTSAICTKITWLTDLRPHRQCAEMKTTSECVKHRVGRTPCAWKDVEGCRRSEIKCHVRTEKYANQEKLAAVRRGEVTVTGVDKLALAITGKICLPPKPNAASVDCELMLRGPLSNARFFTFLPPLHANGAPLLVWKTTIHDGDLIGRPLSRNSCHFDTTISSAPQTLIGWDDETPMTHNTAFLAQSERVIAFGGQHMRSKVTSLVRHTGIWRLQWPTHAFSELWSRRSDNRPTSAKVGRSQPQRVIDGSHTGCIDRVVVKLKDGVSPFLPGVCSFDGRLSLAHVNGVYHLHTRQNPTSRGDRYVQHTQSTDLVHWSPFRSVRFLGHDGAEGYEGTGEIYTFGAQRHPLNSSWMLALFPYLPLDASQSDLIRGNRSKQQESREPLPQGVMLHKAKLGSVSLACSRDGVHWSAPTPLLDCLARWNPESTGTGAWRMTVLPVHNGLQVQLDGSLAYPCPWHIHVHCR